jgi:hypothetical protein
MLFSPELLCRTGEMEGKKRKEKENETHHKVGTYLIN